MNSRRRRKEIVSTHVAPSFARSNYAFLKVYRFIVRRRGQFNCSVSILSLYAFSSIFPYFTFYSLLINFTDNKIDIVVLLVSFASQSEYFGHYHKYFLKILCICLYFNCNIYLFGFFYSFDYILNGNVLLIYWVTVSSNMHCITNSRQNYAKVKQRFLYSQQKY